MEVDAPFKIILEIDQDDAFDYKTASSNKFTKFDYLQIIRKEAGEM